MGEETREQCHHEALIGMLEAGKDVEVCPDCGRKLQLCRLEEGAFCSSCHEGLIRALEEGESGFTCPKCGNVIRITENQGFLLIK